MNVIDVKDSLNIDKSIEYWNSRSFEEYRLWLDQGIKLNRFTTLYLFLHLHNFLTLYHGTLADTRFVYLEKQFECSLELKLLDWANSIFLHLAKEFSTSEPKIRRLQALLRECIIDSQQNEMAANHYKKLIENNLEDKTSFKRLLMHLRSEANLTDLRALVTLWNEYLKVHMDDQEGWLELSELYTKLAKYKEAIYCLEEMLLHHPYDYDIFTRIADISSTIGSPESLSSAIKYYSESLLIKPTPRAFWGLVHVFNNLYKTKKCTEEKHIQIYKIAKKSLEQLYSESATMKDIKIDSLLKLNL